MGIPIWRPPTPASEPILSPSAAHRLAVHRRHRRPAARDRDRNTQTFADYYRQSIGSTSSSSQLWRELNTLPPTAVRRMPRPENEEEHLAAVDEARRMPHPIVLPLPIPPEQRQHIRARMASASAAMRRVQRRAEVPPEDNDEEEESEGTGDENMRPRPPLTDPDTRPFITYMDGLGDRESPDQPSTSSWAALLPDDIGFATACDLWDDGELLGIGFGMGADGIEAALMEFRRRRDAVRGTRL